MAVAGQTEELTVTAEAPLIDVKDSGVGEIITATQIENLPLNGRQFGNLAALVPGVSLGFHTDPTKSTQFAPQVAGGGGRNINYLIDGGDNNDDTVGGMVQNFPLDSIGEFNFETQRFRADSGRANGGTLKVVTKSGTNELRGSVFEYFRDKSLNAHDGVREARRRREGRVPEAPVRRQPGRPHHEGQDPLLPVLRARAAGHPAGVTTVRHDGGRSTRTRTASSTSPSARTWRSARSRTRSTPTTTCRCATATTTTASPTAPARRRPPENWGDSKNTFHSANANLNSVLGGGQHQRVRVPVLVLQERTSWSARTCPPRRYPGGVTVGQSVNTPAADRAAQVPVPRRLHLEHGPPRDQGGRRASSTSPRSTSPSPPASSRCTRT